MSNLNKVRAWEETVVIPTYETSEPDKNPLFLEKRVYQGSSGKVYPLPVTEKIFDEKKDKEYKAVYIENDYLKIMILPSLGGRIQRAYDKTNEYDFVYHNTVIKPALVGLVGPWISGGIEFNWPQHHRPTTYSPTEYFIESNEDGSQTVWVGEIDQMYGTKGMAGFTLHPDKAYIEITGKVFNRTDIPQTFLWWANPAVPVNDHTTSIFPPDVHAVMDHGKRAVSSFPIATGTYYKFDYSEGIDISKYKNIKVPTSYMAYHSDYDFIGNYDEKKEAGLLHVADHHVSPGKKQWTWGNSDFGKAWDRNLTDESGPYIELMTGVFTDNQPDFSWLKPYEEKEFKQYFMPYKGVGRVKNATVNGAVNLEISEKTALVKVYTTSLYEDATITVNYRNKTVFEKQDTLSPLKSSAYTFKKDFDQEESEFSVSVSANDGSVIVYYKVESSKTEELPEPAEAIAPPAELQSTEELFLAATHLEQYRHATLNPEDYYREGLKRDQTDIRLNNGYGEFLYKKGLFAKSKKYLSAAVKKQMWKTPNPLYGEPLFNKGLAHKQLGQLEEAYDSFYKATWNEDTKGKAFYQLALLENKTPEKKQVDEFLRISLVHQSHNMKARHFSLVRSRKIGKDIAVKLQENLSIDPLDLGSRFEEFKYSGNKMRWLAFMRGSVNNFVELAWDYAEQNEFEEAIEILDYCEKEQPLLQYYKAYFLEKSGKDSVETVRKGEEICPDYCFPNKLSDLLVLKWVIKEHPSANYAKYYLGNFYYDKGRYDEAIDLWEEAAKVLKDFPTVYRNLSFAYYNKKEDSKKALQFIEKALEIDSSDSRLLLEQDQLMSKLSYSVADRIRNLEENKISLKVRDDLYIEYLALLNISGQYERVLKLMDDRVFHPWEGGEGKVRAQYTFALIECAKSVLNDNPEKAIELLEKTLNLPENLGEGKLPNNFDTITHYYLGKAYQNICQSEKAQTYFKQATVKEISPESALYYNDQPSDTIFYQGLSYEALGNITKAKSRYKDLISFGEAHFSDDVKYDYFAVSLPNTNVLEENIGADNQEYCQYLLALGKIGLGEKREGERLLENILKRNPSHQGAIRHLAFCKDEEAKK